MHQSTEEISHHVFCCRLILLIVHLSAFEIFVNYSTKTNANLFFAITVSTVQTVQLETL